VGMYAVAYKFVDLTHFVATSLSLPFLTLLVASWPGDMPRFRATVRRGVHFLAVAAVVIVVPAVVFAKPLVTTLFREKYSDASTATAILITAECIGFFATFAFAILVATQNHRSYPIIAGAGLALNVALNFATIPRWSFEAAAVNTLLTEALVGTLVWWVIAKVPGLRPLGLRSVARAPIVVAAGSATGWLAWHVVPWPFAAALSMGTAVVLLHTLSVTGPGGLRALRGSDVLSVPTPEHV
jgi:O-antigen/teichoic acid export membrane protein